MKIPFLSCLVVTLCLVSCGEGTPAPSSPSSSTPSSTALATRPPPAPARPPTRSNVDAIVVPPALRAVVDAPDRDGADRALDAGRKPGELLAFAGIAPGMKVAELAAGGGYTSELLARAVGPTGIVYGQNTPWVLEKFAERPWAQRLAKPINKNIVKVTRELDDPLPPEAKDLDAVLIVLFYHDAYWFEGVDPARMNAAVKRALKPGGQYIVVDHSGRPGTGVSEVKTLHRIDEAAARRDILAAGFALAAEASFLRNPADARDWNASPSGAGERRGTSDRFVLAFSKP